MNATDVRLEISIIRYLRLLAVYPVGRRIALQVGRN